MEAWAFLDGRLPRGVDGEIEGLRACDVWWRAGPCVDRTQTIDLLGTIARSLPVKTKPRYRRWTITLLVFVIAPSSSLLADTAINGFRAKRVPSKLQFSDRWLTSGFCRLQAQKRGKRALHASEPDRSMAVLPKLQRQQPPAAVSTADPCEI